jgi:hypothetical protein
LELLHLPPLGGQGERLSVLVTLWLLVAVVAVDIFLVVEALVVY